MITKWPGPPWFTCVKASATNDSNGDSGWTKLPSILIPPPAPCSSILKATSSYGKACKTFTPDVLNGPVMDEQFWTYGDVVITGLCPTGAGIEICGFSPPT